MSYTQEPHEAHLQLGLLFLDKEDLTKAIEAFAKVGRKLKVIQ